MSAPNNSFKADAFGAALTPTLGNMENRPDSLSIPIGRRGKGWRIVLYPLALFVVVPSLTYVLFRSAFADIAAVSLCLLPLILAVFLVTPRSKYVVYPAVVAYAIFAKNQLMPKAAALIERLIA